MANHDEILLHTGLPPAQVAELLAEVLGGTLKREGDVCIVFRQLSGAREGTVGGPVDHNELRTENPDPGDESIHSGYDTVFDVWASYRHENTQHVEAQKMFSEIIGHLPWPAVHAEEGGLIYSAWDSALGRTDFPPGTTSYADHRGLWEPYACPSAPAMEPHVDHQ